MNEKKTIEKKDFSQNSIVFTHFAATRADHKTQSML